MDNRALRKQIGELLSTQKLGVLATQNQGQPLTSLMAFAATDDLTKILFTSNRATRKFSNLSRDARVSFMVDNRSNSESDFQEATAITICGDAVECEMDRRREWMDVFLAKHRHMQEFVESPTSALLILRVASYSIVTRFQNVLEFIPEKEGAKSPQRYS